MKRSIVIALAMASGLGTWVLLSRGPQAPAPDATQMAQAGTVEVVVFARDLQRGTYLSDDVLTWQRQLQTAVPADAFLRPAADAPVPRELRGMLLRSDVLEGELVRNSALVRGSASFMALAVNPGMRAMAIRVTPDKIAGGFILPEDRVDIVHTVVRDLDGDGTANGYSEVILHNVRVLALGESPTRRNVFQTADEQAAADAQRSETTAQGDTVTLEVSEDQAKVLNSAAAVGQLSLALRAIEDHGAAQIGETLAASERITPAAQASAAPEPPPISASEGGHVVTLIEGGVSKQVRVPATAARQERQP